MSDIQILDASYADPSIFFHGGRGTILREVNGKNNFLKQPRIRKLLIENHVVEYQISSYHGKEYVEVQPFFFPNSAANWSYTMYKDYILVHEKLNQALKREGLALIDGHCFNVVFHFACPKFVDLGSIREGVDTSGYKELRKYKKALLSYRVSSAPFTRSRLDSELESPKYSDVVKDILTRDYFSRKNKALRLLGFYRPTTWKKYYGRSPESYTDTPKTEALIRILKALKPKTVYDIGCNTGYYSFIAESFGASVVACDPDPDCVDYLYNRVKADNKKILPLVADVDGLLRAVGRAYESLRPKSVDTVFMLALIHHLVYRLGYDFDDVFAKVRQLGAKSLVLEFVSEKDRNVCAWNQKNPRHWYRLDYLCKVGRKYFANCEIHDDHDAERPIILFYGRAAQ